MLTDKQDYEEIYQKYKNLVMKAAYKYSGNYDIAEDKILHRVHFCNYICISMN